MRRLLLATALACLLSPAAVLASGDDVIRDCTDDGVIQGKYSQGEYRDALRNLPTDVDEYTDCRDVIKRAQQGVGGGGGPGGNGTGTGPGATGTGAPPAGGDPLATATPAERAAVAAAQAGGNGVVLVGGKQVQPGALGVGGLGSPVTLPNSLIAMLVALGIAAAAALATFVRNLVVARRAGP